MYLHPSLPPDSVDEAYYKGFGLLGTGAQVRHYQTSVGLLRIILSGVFDRFPHQQVIVGHWGEPMIEYFRSNIYITPGGIAGHRYLGWAIDVVGPDRIMHATDYPFNGERDFAARDFLAEADISDDVCNKISFQNWEQLVKGIIR
ncbi:amidohydrolase family protein [Rhodococcus sp. G-MC3]|uniref:amidohydrolase family protein n=1 Tax=Rhodococcus sp. G-MC3 TaxID=3046209 RepID=UPI0024BB0FC9|nr:amidohydrolase family protein [Rhodococcus sp. G-MC3]MDJ0396109.1 amidohydrolase family protein [Rhodococcus sp. G-MC3]